MTCPNCGALMDSNDRHCNYCGTAVVTAAQNTGNTYNYYYGAPPPGAAPQSSPHVQIIPPQSNPQYAPQEQYRQIGQKDKYISLVLALFLGWLGVHRFYEGKIMTGILYLLTFGLFGVGVIADLIIIALKPRFYYPR